MKRAVFFLLLLLLVAFVADARVGGGESYAGGGGGSSGGGGGGDGGGAELLFYILRFLIWLTIEYPAIGIPVDIVVVVFVVRWWRTKNVNTVTTIATSAPVAAAMDSHQHQAGGPVVLLDDLPGHARERAPHGALVHHGDPVAFGHGCGWRANPR